MDSVAVFPSNASHESETLQPNEELKQQFRGCLSGRISDGVHLELEKSKKQPTVQLTLLFKQMLSDLYFLFLQIQIQSLFSEQV